MTYEIYRYIFLGGAILTGVMLVVSVLVFFLLKIPTVIGDLTGSNARKAIENIRNMNASTGDKTYQSSVVNRERGRITDKISRSGRLNSAASLSDTGAMSTEKLRTSGIAAQTTASETTVLAPEPASETTVLAPETTVLSAQPAGETMVLTGDGTQNASVAVNSSVAVAPASHGFASDFVVEYEITFIHTQEIVA